MIFGRNTQQINGALVATMQFFKLVVGQLVILAVLDQVMAGVIATLLDGLTGLLGFYIIVLANTKTTPTDSPQLKANTSVVVVDEQGTRLGEVQLPTPPPSPIAQDVPTGTPVAKPATGASEDHEP